MSIVWDEHKRQLNLRNRRLDFADLDEEFFVAALVVPAQQERYKAIGWFDNEPHAVIFKPLGSEALSIISLRRASNRERKLL
jgi:uncharacterized DUF497 family protein